MKHVVNRSTVLVLRQIFQNVANLHYMYTN